MKRKIITGLILGASLFGGSVLLNSCNDALDIVQPGQIVDDEVFVSVANMKTYLNGSVYANLEPSYGNYLTAVLTDEVRPGSGSGGQEFGLHRYFLDNSDTQTGKIWAFNYLVIGRIGRLIELSKNVKPATQAEQDEYNKVIAEARAIRAYCYLEIEKYFSTDIKDDNALGGMIVSGLISDPLNVNIPRATNKAVFDVINADLDYARSILSYGGDSFYVNKTFVAAVSARANLYRGNYALAKQYAQEAINNGGVTLTKANPTQSPNATFEIGTPAWNVYFYNTTAVRTTVVSGDGLIPAGTDIPVSYNPYRQMWQDTNKGESLFTIQRLVPGSGLAIGTFWNTNQSTINGNPMWSWGYNLRQLFITSGDIRRYAYIDPTSAGGEYVIDKFPGKTGSATRNDVKVIRLSEMYFILAECEVEANNFPAAANAVQEVRNARFYANVPATPTYTSAQQAYVDILKERRIELALEGHRYIDLKRLATKAGVTMDRDLNNDDNVPTSNLPNNSYKYTLPIPLAEISANQGMKGQQNPGYN